jgi:quercetin dioxygenase-like cupin family protein
MLQVLQATDALDASTQLLELDYTETIDALLAGEIDVAIVPQLDGSPLQRALAAPDIRIMNVAQAEAIAKTVPGLKHVVLWRGLISLGRDIPSSDIDLLASRNRLLVRKDLHPALQYLLLEAMREVHRAPGPFNRLDEFPAEQPNDLPLSPAAEAFYRSGPTFWQRYTSFWLTSLLNRILFFVIPFVATLIPIIAFAPRFFRWLFVRRIDQLHRALGKLERELGEGAAGPGSTEHRTRLAEIESAVRSLKVARPFEVDLQRLKAHLRMVQENVSRLGAVTGGLPGLAAAGAADAQAPTAGAQGRNGMLQITRAGSQPSRQGTAEYFTGAVRIDPLFQPPDPSRVSGASVTFEPAARTAWHTHPLGQTLIITSGLGWVQREGGSIEEVRTGDVVWFPAGLKHWHGATPTTAMTHIAIQESLNGKNVDWMEEVTDEQYPSQCS